MTPRGNAQSAARCRVRSLFQARLWLHGDARAQAPCRANRRSRCPPFSLEEAACSGCDPRSRRGRGRQTWVTPIIEAPTALDGIARVFRSIAAGLDQRGGVAGCPLNNLVLELAGQDEDFRQALDAIFEMWRKAIAGKIQDDQRRGHLSNRDAEGIATLVVAVYSGGMAMAKSRQNSMPLRQSMTELSALLLEHDRTPPRSRRKR